MSTAIPESEPPVAVNSIRPILRLSADNWPQVATFTCARRGEVETLWEQDVSEWIKSPGGTGGALDLVESGAAEVWLYEDETGRLIGFISLSVEYLEGTENVRRSGSVYSVPYFGIHTHFRGKPDGPREQRYAWRIFQGLIDEAERRGEHELLTLYVAPENPAYQGFYPLFGFAEVDRVTIGEREWVRMARRLDLQSKDST